MKVTVIGVAGGTGSGKSTLVKRLQEAFEGDDVVRSATITTTRRIRN